GFHVTGVQTCALPISGTATRLAGRFDVIFPQGSDDTIGELAAIGSGLRGVAAELHTLAETAEADDLARADAILGAIAASLEARQDRKSVVEGKSGGAG